MEETKKLKKRRKNKNLNQPLTRL
jgi:hypothetical protein